MISVFAFKKLQRLRNLAATACLLLFLSQLGLPLLHEIEAARDQAANCSICLQEGASTDLAYSTRKAGHTHHDSIHCLICRNFSNPTSSIVTLRQAHVAPDNLIVVSKSVTQDFYPRLFLRSHSSRAPPVLS